MFLSKQSSRNFSKVFLNLSLSDQSRSCRYTLKELKPRFLAKFNSLLIVSSSKVSLWNISSWLIAVLGKKLQPTSQGCSSYQLLAFSLAHFTFSSLINQNNNWKHVTSTYSWSEIFPKLHVVGIWKLRICFWFKKIKNVKKKK